MNQEIFTFTGYTDEVAKRLNALIDAGYKIITTACIPSGTNHHKMDIVVVAEKSKTKS